GWLPGSKADGDSNQLPTIAIVASYDTFGAAPALSVGSDSNGSGVVALLEIARLFSILYSNPNTRGRYNILFGLTSGGPYNYNGTQKGKTGYGFMFLNLQFEGLSNVAEEVWLTVGLKQKKINVSNSRVAGSMKPVFRGKSYCNNTFWTFSSIGFIGTYWREFVNEAAVVKSLKVVAKSLARHIYGQHGKNINIFANSSLAVNPSYIRSWLDLISRTPRVAPFLSKDNAISNGIKEGISRSRCTEYIEQGKPLGGLLVLLPQILRPEKSDTVGGHDDTSSDKENLKKQILTYHITQTRGGTLFVRSECDEVRYKLIVSSPAPKKLSSLTIMNIQGWLPGSKADGDSNQLPTIAIVVSYDTFGAAPALSVGSDSNGSGVVAFLKIARLFSILYSNPNTSGRYNILFGLTSGGPYNYNGTQKWLRSFDQRLRERIDYAICLNSLGSGKNGLWLHVSKPPENAYVKQIFEGLSNVAEDVWLTVGLKQKKINVSNSRVAGSMKPVFRGKSYCNNTFWTFSSIGFIGTYWREFVNEAAVVKSLKVVAKSLARHIYGQHGKNINIFANSSLAVNPSYIRSWLDLISRTPRVAPFLSKDNAISNGIKEDHVVEVNLQHDVLDGMFTFYDSTVSTLQIFQVASVTFDLLFLLGLGSYLITLFSLLVITTRDGRHGCVFEERESNGKYVMPAVMVEIRRDLLKHFVQKLLDRHDGKIMFNNFEDLYKDRFKMKLNYRFYGLSDLENLCEILKDILVVVVGEPSGEKVINAVKRYNLRKRKR
ncbi:nicalin-1-like protein, partial [Tanacetum coccineum]